MTEDRTDSASASFAALGLDTKIVDALTALGYEEPTPIQQAAIPAALEGRDILGQAATGTGKTAAFALPLLQRLIGSAEPRGAAPFALILVPTRELAVQVSEAVHRYGRAHDVSVLPIYGGQPFTQQLRVLRRGVDVVVATPGRALDHIGRGTLDLGSVAVVVLDEADEMLDMGFADDLEAILAATPEQRQTVLFSATMPPRIGAIARRHLRDPAHIRLAGERVPEGAVPKIRQLAFVVPRAHKPAALGRVLDMENPDAAIVFCRTRQEVDELAEKMNAHGYRAEPLHGGMSQEQRDRVMKKLRAGAADLIIATDVAARGLDIAQLSHVINYDVPSAPESYVHRIGRVGRAGREGVAITLAEPREHRLIRNIEHVAKQRIEVGRLPTVADLRARRLELVRASIREALLEGDLDRYRVVVGSLAEEFDPMEIALAAVKLAQVAIAPEGADEAEIPDLSQERPRDRRSSDAADGPTGPRGRQARGRDADPGARGRKGGARARLSPASGVARLYIGAGRDAGVRPQDLVGAITGEAGISGREIGAIDIADGFSIVEVAEDVASDVVQALRASKIKGRRVTVRRDRSGR